FLLVPRVQLEDEGLSTHEAVIDETVWMVRIGPMHMRPEQGLVPGTAGFHVPHCDQCLRSDRRSLQLSHEALRTRFESCGAFIRRRRAIGRQSFNRRPTECDRAAPAQLAAAAGCVLVVVVVMIVAP